MYSCTECEWQESQWDGEIHGWVYINEHEDGEYRCPKCGAELDWNDGTEEGTIW